MDEIGDELAGDALAALARELVEDIAAARVLELSGQPGMVDGSGVFHPAPPPPPGPEQADRLRGPSGQWQPPPPGPAAGWGWTLRNPENRSHLLGADEFMNSLYGRSPGPGRQAAVAAHGNRATGPADGPESPSDGTVDEPGTEVLPGRELEARGLYKAARGKGAGVDVQMEQPKHPDALPVRPRQRAPLDRYGRRRNRGR